MPAAAGLTFGSVALIVFGGIGIIGTLAAAALFVTGQTRKTIADQRIQDLESQATTINIQAKKLASQTAELFAAKQTIDVLTANMKSGEDVLRLLESMERRFREERKP